MPVAPLTHTDGKKLCFCFETLSIAVGMKSIRTSVSIWTRYAGVKATGENYDFCMELIRRKEFDINRIKLE